MSSSLNDNDNENDHDSPISNRDSDPHESSPRPAPIGSSVTAGLAASTTISSSTLSTASSSRFYENGSNGAVGYHHHARGPHYYSSGSSSSSPAASSFVPPGGCSLNKMVNPSLSQDTTLTKVFVGGLAWQTKSETLHKHFSQYGDILEAVVIMDKTTGRSKGFGFVTFSEKESAEKATANPNPMIDNRRANCNLAALGASKRPPTRRHDFDGYEPQSYAVPGNMSMQLQYQVPGAAYSPELSNYRTFEFSEGLPNYTYPAAYTSGYDSPSTTSSPLYSPSVPYTPYTASFFHYPQTPPSPAYFYPQTPGSGHLRLHYSPEYISGAPGGPAVTGPSGAPLQGPPPPLVLPHSHPNAVALGTQEGDATTGPSSADSSARRVPSDQDHNSAGGQPEAPQVNGYQLQQQQQQPRLDRASSGDLQHQPQQFSPDVFVMFPRNPHVFSSPGRGGGGGGARFSAMQSFPGGAIYSSPPGGYAYGGAGGSLNHSHGVASPQRGRSRGFAPSGRFMPAVASAKPQHVSQAMDAVVNATQMDAHHRGDLVAQFQRLDVQDQSAHGV